jgi:hypothetical protein
MTTFTLNETPVPAVAGEDDSVRRKVYPERIGKIVPGANEDVATGKAFEIGGTDIGLGVDEEGSLT